MILGVTGGIGGGKTTVTKLLQEHGAVIVSADKLARELVEPGSTTLEQVVRQFGVQVLGEDGSLDRKKLGQIVFADSQARRVLEGIMHPAIAELSCQRLRDAAAQHRIVVYEAPLLFEANARGRVDKVLCITVDPQVQLERLQQRDGCSKEEAREKIAAQMPQQKKAELSDYVIDNSADLATLKARIDTFWTCELENPSA